MDAHSGSGVAEPGVVLRDLDHLDALGQLALGCLHLRTRVTCKFIMLACLTCVELVNFVW